MIEKANSKQSLPLGEGEKSESFSDRLRLLVGSESVRAFAKAVGVGQTTLQQYLHGSIPGLDKAEQIASYKNVSLKWLATGEGPMNSGQATSVDIIPGEMKLVPRLDVRAAAGNGSLNHAEDTVGLMAFQATWLMEHGINPNFARVLTATGDSMEPTIRDGDLLVVDTSIDSLVNHGIYVVIYAGLLLVKRVTRRIDGSIVIRSDNRNLYDDEIVAADATVELIIAGRVCWAGRTL